MRVTSLWNPLPLTLQAHCPLATSGLSQPQRFDHNAVSAGFSSKFNTAFRMPSVFRYAAKDHDEDDVVIRAPWGGIIPTDADESVDDKPRRSRIVPPDMTTIIEQRRKRQEEDDQRSWDNVLRIPVDSPEDRERWIEEQKRREEAEKSERRDERGVVIIDYNL